MSQMKTRQNVGFVPEVSPDRHGSSFATGLQLRSTLAKAYLLLGGGLRSYARLPEEVMIFEHSGWPQAKCTGSAVQNIRF
eukprot:scaffold71909_cov59-Attheya_sp.AAC.2